MKNNESNIEIINEMWLSESAGKYSDQTIRSDRVTAIKSTTDWSSAGISAFKPYYRAC